MDTGADLTLSPTETFSKTTNEATMLKISSCPEWTHDVTISVPVDGGFENQTCKVRYRLLDETAIEPTDATNVAVLLRNVVVRMDDIADEEGRPLTWNDALRDRLFVPRGTPSDENAAHAARIRTDRSSSFAASMAGTL